MQKLPKTANKKKENNGFWPHSKKKERQIYSPITFYLWTRIFYPSFNTWVEKWRGLRAGGFLWVCCCCYCTLIYAILIIVLLYRMRHGG